MSSSAGSAGLNLFYGRPKVRLGTLGNVRTEMAHVYRSAVRGDVTWVDATKAAYVLNLIANLDQGLGADARLTELEQRLASVKPNGQGHAHDTRGRRL